MRTTKLSSILLFTSLCLFTSPLKREKNQVSANYTPFFVEWIFLPREPVREVRSVTINGVQVQVNTEWLTDEQLSELGQLSEDEKNVMTKIREFYDALEHGSPAQKLAKEKITDQCYLWMPEVTTEQERTELQSLHKTDHRLCKEKVADFMDRLPIEKKNELEKYWHFCEHVWYGLDEGHHSHGEEKDEDESSDGEATVTSPEATTIEPSVPESEGIGSDKKEENGGEPGNKMEEKEKKSEADGHQHHQHHHHHHRLRRRRRDEQSILAEPNLEDYFKTHLSWLSDSQKELLRTKKAEGKTRVEMQQEVLRMFDALGGEDKNKARELLKSGCRTVLRSVIGETKADELKQMRESGVAPEELGKKVDEIFAAIEDKSKKAKIAEYGAACKQIFGIPSASRKRRHHHDHDHHEHHHGGHSLEDYFKTHLTWLTDDQKEQLRAMKTEGKSRFELQQKALSFFEKLAGEEKEKATAQLQDGCRELIRMVFGEEKATMLKKMRESGTPTGEMAKKIDELVGSLEDEKKKGIAKEYGPICKRFFGIEASSKSRRRRDEGTATAEGAAASAQIKMEEAFKTYLNWLTDDQKEHLKALRGEGRPNPELYAKIFGYFEQLSGESQEKARALLQDGCRAILRELFGNEKANEVKQMRESGTPVTEIAKKIDSYANELTQTEKKTRYEHFKPHCSKLFGHNPDTSVAAAGRKRRNSGWTENHHQYFFDSNNGEYDGVSSGGVNENDAFSSSISSSSSSARPAKRNNIGRGESGSDAYSRRRQSNRIGDGVSSSSRGIVQGAAGVQQRWGGEGIGYGGTVSALQADTEDGTTDQEDEEDSASATAAAAEAAERRASSRFGRGGGGRAGGGDGDGRQTSIGDGAYNDVNNNNDDDNGDDYQLEGEQFQPHNRWLNRQQKQRLKQWKQDGHSGAEMHSHLLDMYDVSDNTVKSLARGILVTGCEAIMERLFGSTEARQIISELRRRPPSDRNNIRSEAYQEERVGEESSTTDDSVDNRIANAVDNIDGDEDQRRDAAKYALNCRRIFSMLLRRKRDAEIELPQKYSLEHGLNNYLSWLSDTQKEELKEMKAAGKDRSELQAKIMSYFKETKGEPRAAAFERLKAGCCEIITDLVGEEKAEELKQLHLSGKMSELEEKTTSYVSAVTDPTKKLMAKFFGPACREIMVQKT